MVNDETLAANLMERDVISSEIIAVIEVSKKVNKIITKKNLAQKKVRLIILMATLRFIIRHKRQEIDLQNSVQMNFKFFYP